MFQGKFLFSPPDFLTENTFPLLTPDVQPCSKLSSSLGIKYVGADASAAREHLYRCLHWNRKESLVIMFVKSLLPPLESIRRRPKRLLLLAPLVVIEQNWSRALNVHRLAA